MSLDQLLAEGITRSAVQRRVASGALVRAHRSVYIWPGAPWTTASADHAALLRFGPHAVLSHLTAASHHGLCAPGDAIWITVRSSTRAATAAAGVRVFRTRHLESMRRRDGLAMTPLPRTLVDLAQCLDERELRAVYLKALQRGSCSADDVKASLDLVGRSYPGSALCRRVTQELLPEMESILGAEGFALLKPHFRTLKAGVPVECTDGRTRICDLAIPELRIDIECDSWAHHSSRAQRRADGQRDRAMFASGMMTIRLLTDDIRRAPTNTVREVLATAEQRRRDLGRS